MHRALSKEEKSRLERHITHAEKRTGVQIVLSVVERSDNYAEIPWKAFALGISFMGFVILILNLKGSLASSVTVSWISMVMTLSVGVSLASLCIFVPGFARLFLNTHRADMETRQYAESLFLSRELFATHDRRAVLLVVSLFERRIVVLPDTGLVELLNHDAIQRIIQCMRLSLQAGQTDKALKSGLEKLEEILSGNSPPASSVNELSDDIIEEKGV